MFHVIFKQLIVRSGRVAALAAATILGTTIVRPGVGEPFNASAEMTELMMELLPPELHEVQRRTPDEPFTSSGSLVLESIGIPADAVRTDGDQRYVIRVVNNIARRVDVQVVGFSNTGRTVRVTGLKPGDVIVSQPLK